MTQGDFFFGDGEMDPLDLDSGLGMGGPCSMLGNGLSSSVPAGSVSNNVPAGEEWLLPSEAFPIRHEIQNRSPPPETFPNHLDTSEQGMRLVDTYSRACSLAKLRYLFLCWKLKIRKISSETCN